MQIKNQNNILGGAYIKYMEIIEAFLKEGWTVHHISPKGFSNIQNDRLFHYGVKNFLFKIHTIPFLLSTLFLFIEINKIKNIDVVFTFSYLEGAFSILFKCINPKIKIIVFVRSDHISGYDVEYSNSIYKNIYIKFLELTEFIVLRYSDKVFFVSEYNRNASIKRTGYKNFEKTKVIYNNYTSRVVNLSLEQPISYKSKNLKIVGYVGSLHLVGKGLENLVRAFRQIKNRLPNVKLIIVGDGPGMDELVLLVKELDLGRDVVITGYQNNPIRYIKGFDILISPSLHEGFSQVILEALYNKIPVIATRVGGTPEILHYDDLLFEPNNSVVIADVVIELLKNNQKYEKIKKLCEIRRQLFFFEWGDIVIEEISTLINPASTSGRQ